MHAALARHYQQQQHQHALLFSARVLLRKLSLVSTTLSIVQRYTTRYVVMGMVASLSCYPCQVTSNLGPGTAELELSETKQQKAETWSTTE